MTETTHKNQKKVYQEHLLYISKMRKHKVIKKNKFNKKRKVKILQIQEFSIWMKKKDL